LNDARSFLGVFSVDPRKGQCTSRLWWYAHAFRQSCIRACWCSWLCAEPKKRVSAVRGSQDLDVDVLSGAKLQHVAMHGWIQGSRQISKRSYGLQRWKVLMCLRIFCRCMAIRSNCGWIVEDAVLFLWSQLLRERSVPLPQRQIVLQFCGYHIEETKNMLKYYRTVAIIEGILVSSLLVVRCRWRVTLAGRVRWFWGLLSNLDTCRNSLKYAAISVNDNFGVAVI